MMSEAPREQWLIDLYAELREEAGENYDAFIAERGRVVRIWMSEYARASWHGVEDDIRDNLFVELSRWEAGAPALI